MPYFLHLPKYPFNTVFIRLKILLRVTSLFISGHFYLKIPILHRHLSEQQKTLCLTLSVDCVWNVMAHAQKPYFVFRRNGRFHFNRRGASVQSTTGSRDVRISDSNAGYTTFRGSVKSTGYPLYSPVSPSLTLPCITVCHHISTGLYLNTKYKFLYQNSF